MAGGNGKISVMEIKEAKRLAIAHMDYYGLTNQGWTFEWMNSLRRLGETSVTPSGVKRIRLSYALTEARSERDVTQTIIHECAHAIVGIRAGHGPRWKAQMRAMGAKPERLSTHTEETLLATKGKFKYTLECPETAKYIGGMSRKVTAKTYRYICPCHKQPIRFIRNW